jgi:phosphoribosyl 1,2-cyclic phosphodiesterase
MKIKIHYTGSKGNLYTIDNGKDKLLIEAGVTIKKINKAVNFNLSDYSACLCSHEHLDHSLSVPDLISRGIDVYAIKEVFESLDIDSSFAHVVEPKKQFKINSFNIVTFEVKHDVKNVGFLISDGKNKLLYATDCYKIINKFKDLTHILIECNYDIDILNYNLEKGKIHKTVYNRVINSHMEVYQTQEFLKHNISNKTKEVFLIHKSQNNL